MNIVLFCKEAERRAAGKDRASCEPYYAEVEPIQIKTPEPKFRGQAIKLMY